MNLAGARLAREAAAAYENRFVAGSLGPTNVTLSLSPKVDDPSYRDVTFDQLKDGYAEAARALQEGGVDFLLIETVFDTLNGKAAIAAVKEAAPDLPLFMSVTIVDRSGRNLSGQTVEAWWNSVEHADPFAAGINCSLGATEMRPYIESLSRVAPVYVTCYPNAGLPNSFGGYDEEPPITSRLLRDFAASGFLNAAGGCCGTTPEHIRQIRKAVAGLPPRQIPERVERAKFSGLEPPEIARIPIMVDSSKWSVLEAGLKCLQGKGVCNSISLKEGEEAFLDKARVVREYGAAVVVMAFDEKGQADTLERKVGICERAYKLLIEKIGRAHV